MYCCVCIINLCHQLLRLHRKFPLAQAQLNTVITHIYIYEEFCVKSINIHLINKHYIITSILLYKDNV